VTVLHTNPERSDEDVIPVREYRNRRAPNRGGENCCEFYWFLSISFENHSIQAWYGDCYNSPLVTMIAAAPREHPPPADWGVKFKKISSRRSS